MIPCARGEGREWKVRADYSPRNGEGRGEEVLSGGGEIRCASIMPVSRELSRDGLLTCWNTSVAMGDRRYLSIYNRIEYIGVCRNRTIDRLENAIYRFSTASAK